MSARREWCPDCRRRQTVTDDHLESYYTPAGEVGYRVLDLACGHDLSVGRRVIGPAPGAPWAGHGVAAPTIAAAIKERTGR